MRNLVILMSLLVLISACGDQAPTDAVVTGPDDSTVTLPRSSLSSTLTFFPLEFTVRNENGVALPEIEIEFFRGGINGQTILLDDKEAAVAAPSLKTITDSGGNGRVGFAITVPGCADTEDVSASGSVLATVKSASFNWSLAVTRTCATATS